MMWKNKNKNVADEETDAVETEGDPEIDAREELQKRVNKGEAKFRS